MFPTLLSIAGSDPTGGAGIQADLKTFASLGVYGAAAITCITVQNSLGVTNVKPLDTEFVEAQILAVLEDHHVTHIKTGMIGTVAIARCVGRLLEDFRGVVVCDPVMLSTTGQELLANTTVEELKKTLLAQATLLTPNLPELAAITGYILNSETEALQAAETLFDDFPALQAVVVKGGHQKADSSNITDHLILRAGKKRTLISLPHSRIASQNTHGTGCTFASALTAFHSLSNDWSQAFAGSVNYLETILRQSAKQQIIKNDRGHGPLLHHCWNKNTARQELIENSE